MKSNRIIIIGAGPAGLTLAFELKKRNIESLIIEKGPDAGHSWRNMPSHLKMISPWYSNRLPSMDGEFEKDYRMPAIEFAKHLKSYQAKHHLRVEYNTDVLNVTKSNDGIFNITTTDKSFQAETVVCCAGYFSNSVKPEVPGLYDGHIPVTMFSDFKNLNALSSKPKSVLIIGKRLSAGQLIDECAKENIEIALSIRSPLMLGPKPSSFAAIFAFRNIPRIEKLLLAIGRTHHRYDIRMQSEHANALIKAGKLRIYPEIDHVAAPKNGNTTGIVHFKTGEHKSFDHIFIAAGFSPAFHFLDSLIPSCDRLDLSNGFESTDTKDLFFLGLDGQRNFRSRFLRGIREDAAVLASVVETRFKTRN